MLTFLASSGLLALLGVAVPVAIHLWNRRPGRVVAVGSIRWLLAGANRRMRSLKLEQLALLLLRVAVVVLLALAVAEPAWQRPGRAPAGQILLSADVLTSGSLAVIRPTIDSLRRRGFALRRLAAGFPRLSDTLWQQLNQPSPDSTALPAISADRTASFWPRVAQATDSFPNQLIQVYTSAALRHFQGIRPALPARVAWQTVPLPPTKTTWLQAASLSGPDSLRLLVSRSSEEGTSARSFSVRRPRQTAILTAPQRGLPPLHYYPTAAGPASIRVAGPDSARVPVQPPLRVWVYYDAAHAPDAQYLRAALRAAALGLPTRLVLTVSSTAPAATTPADWLFWLADAAPPVAWQARVARGLRLWQDGRQPGVFLPTSFSVVPLRESFPLTRLDTQRRAGAAVLWRTATGRPVLSRRLSGRGASYYFHSRLHPAWSQLAESSELPELWLTLLRPILSAPTPPQDQRLLDRAQLRPQQRPPTTVAQPLRPAADTTALRVWLVLAAALLWALERLVAARISSLLAAPL
ncbi:N-terminal double-transmembrane domain-containing protein [Hymenobacter daecheongensis DSM 21074]|uniref:N-terminal double-transmembrane domain-containing protein n=1 Tax=Hymenobacter daecheongensis DSM 21074 TaxID=1121955 RepID=A0A1M6ITM0_9BACT|nr:BatA domain-containing protein [Hymenobacter daecheongensis]SHJ37791.1 N-terminal double-transmembrane domain-containing protein [Hymenobacter daecheongensis DSM 21074]